MKTAISIPQEVYESAEELASQLGQSRSQLYTKAVSSYVAKYKKENVTAQLDAVYSANSSLMDTSLVRLQSKSLPKEKW